jgi:hypothetical protein
MYDYIPMKEVWTEFQKDSYNHRLYALSMLIWDGLYGLCVAVSLFLKKKEV